MPLPLSGPISASQINTELRLTSNGLLSLNNSSVRTLFSVPSGQISYSNGYGKVFSRAAVTATISSHTNKGVITLSNIPGYIAGQTDVTVIINNGIYCWSDDINTAALTINGHTTGDTLDIINGGNVLGMGGSGYWAGYLAALTGGPALNVSLPARITNNGVLAGGGGGGGCSLYSSNYGGGGGGAGGGKGGGSYGSDGTYIIDGPVGGTIGNIGNSGYYPSAGAITFTGASGGRIISTVVGLGSRFAADGVTALAPTGGNAGGSGHAWIWFYKSAGYYGPAGGGGGWGAAGGYGDSGGVLAPESGNGGALGNVGQNGPGGNNAYPGAAGGKAIVTNGNAITWVTTGTVYGIVG